MLEIRGLSTGYGRHTIVRDVDLTLRAAEIVSIIGANGSGKSTLVKAISGLLPAHGGAITVSGQNVKKLSPRARVLLGIAHVPEGRQVFARLTVAENLRLGLYAQRAALGRSEIEERIRRACMLFPILLERMSEPAGNLSGGQQQMLAIARGLMSNPRILLLDEPSLGLSPLLVSEIFRLIERLRTQGIAILLSEQNARLSLRIADHAYVLESGRVTLEGTGRELLDNPEVAERYLGVGKAVTATHGQPQEARAAELRRILAPETTAAAP